MGGASPALRNLQIVDSSQQGRQQLVVGQLFHLFAFFKNHTPAVAAGDADVGFPGFTGAVDHAAHDRHGDGLLAEHVLTGAKSVGVMGDERTYAYAIAIRAVTTDDFMTADVAPLPYDLLGRISTRIIGEVNGCNRVLYDITTKPPASIEWE
mgnify:CR=1 FL=1